MTDDVSDLWAALLTPPGTGAMAVIRLAGQDAPSVLRRCFAPRRTAAIDQLPADRLAYGRVVDGDETVDDGIVSLRPHEREGYIADVTVHGGVRVVERVLLLFQRLGARIKSDADRTAVSSDRTSIEADVVHALARAKTKRAVRFLARQRVALPRELASIAETCERNNDVGRAMLQTLVDRSRVARLLVDGATLAVLGPVNAGKSTLLNRLFATSQSLVSDVPGTTRDWVGVETAIEGIPIEAIDTAGLRPGADPLEQEAVTRGLRRAHVADAQLIVMDAAAPFPSSFLDSCRAVIDPQRAIGVLNKSDLRPAWTENHLEGYCTTTARTSGLNGDGLSALTEAIVTTLGLNPAFDQQAALFTQGQMERLHRVLADTPAGRLGREIRTKFPDVFSAADRCR